MGFCYTISPGAGWDAAHLRGDRNPGKYQRSRRKAET
nr:MAG TPA: hypothetical protein [Caudoviricetes sp.]